MYVVDGIAYAGEPIEGLRVRAVSVVTVLSLLVTFSTGERRVLDLAPLAEGTPAFAPLREWDVFSRPTVDHGVICWLDGQIDLAPEAAYRMGYRYDTVA